MEILFNPVFICLFCISIFTLGLIFISFLFKELTQNEQFRSKRYTQTGGDMPWDNGCNVYCCLCWKCYIASFLSSSRVICWLMVASIKLHSSARKKARFLYQQNGYREGGRTPLLNRQSIGETGSSGRKFKSCRPDQFNTYLI